MELLSYLCVTPLFYQRLMLHDPSGAAPLRLVLACLTLHDAPLAAPPFARSADKASSAASSKLIAVQPPYCTGKWGGGRGGQGTARALPVVQHAAGCQRLLAFQSTPEPVCKGPPLPPRPAEKGEGAAELLAARGFALLLMLSECEEPGFMDQVGPATGSSQPCSCERTDGMALHTRTQLAPAQRQPGSGCFKIARLGAASAPFLRGVETSNEAVTWATPAQQHGHVKPAGLLFRHSVRCVRHHPLCPHCLPASLSHLCRWRSTRPRGGWPIT